jgi:hypothetical protein
MSDTDHIYPGVDRLQYFLGKISMMVAIIFVVTMFGPQHPIMRLVGLGAMIGGLVLDVLRLRNIGLSQWIALIRFLPFLNIILDVSLLCAQTGWSETRKLDAAGRSILFVELLIIAAMILMFFRFRMLTPFAF